MQRGTHTVRIAILGKLGFIREAHQLCKNVGSYNCVVSYFVSENNEYFSNVEELEQLHGMSLEIFLQTIDPKIDRLLVSDNSNSLYHEYKEVIHAFCQSQEIELYKVDALQFITRIPFLTEHYSVTDLDFLLNRSINKLDIERIASQLKGERLLITGAAGSIGSELVRQLAKYECEAIGVLDQAESPMFTVQLELKEKYPETNFQFFVTDVTLRKRMEHIISAFRPTIIFHAAAYKHVPLMELQPYESIRVNVGGMVNIANLALRYNVKRFVMISSDKAVNPSNVMGACKRICELYLQALSQQPDCLTKFIITRFGNVLGSNGSVVPLFIKQILENRSIALTSKKISRYFMTIREACELVLEAGLVGHKGEIFIFDMGKPIKIYDLVVGLIKAFGLEPHKDVKIKEIGLRPGEKLTEELFGSFEHKLPTHNPKIFISNVEPILAGAVIHSIHELLDALDDDNSEELVRKIKKIVVNYISINSPFIHLDTHK